MEYAFERTKKAALTGDFGADYILENTEDISARELQEFPRLPYCGREWSDVQAPWRMGEFFKCLSQKAMSEFESLATPFCCEATMTLFTEDQQPRSVLFLLEGRVKLSINSSDGRRLILGIASPGDILGVTSAVLGDPYKMTAEPQFHCTITSLERHTFLDFLMRYPIAGQNVSRQLSVEFNKACEQLRILGIISSAPAKLARLLVEWCARGRQTGRGVRIHCPLTHEEIGEYIGTSRETVTRTLADFKSRGLAEQRGSTVIVWNLRALTIWAGSGGQRKIEV